MSPIANISVDEFTTPNPTCVAPDAPLKVILEQMLKMNVRHMVVVNEAGQVCGLISERDILTFSQAQDFNRLVAQDIMVRNLYIVSPEAKLHEVALEMSKNKIGSAIIQDDENQYLGIFTATDALNALVEALRGDLASTSIQMTV